MRSGGQEWADTIDEDESQWPPNPYQAQAEAQVRAGAWPGASLLMRGKNLRSRTLIEDTQPELPTQFTQRQPTMLSFSEPAEPTGLTSPPPPQYNPIWTKRTRGEDQQGESVLEEQVVNEGGDSHRVLPVEKGDGTEPIEAPIPNSGGSSSSGEGANWNGTPWRFLFEFRASDRTIKDGGLGTGNASNFVDFDSSDEGDVDADLPRVTSSDFETPESTSEAKEGDDSSTTCSQQAQASRKLSHQCVPRNKNLAQNVGDQIETDEISTLMIRNIPNLYTRSMLMEELDTLGFRYEYDFLYLPIDKSTQWNVGYAFVNFTSPQAATRGVSAMTNYTFCRFENDTGKVAQVSIAHMQGLERNLMYYSNTAVQCARIQSHRPLNLTQKQLDANMSGQKAHRHRRRRKKNTSADDKLSPNLVCTETCSLVDSESSCITNQLPENKGCLPGAPMNDGEQQIPNLGFAANSLESPLVGCQRPPIRSSRASSSEAATSSAAVMFA